MPLYIAPYQISTDQPNVPLEGTFTVPVCTTPDRFKKIMDALWYGGLVTGQTGDYDHLIDWLDACTRITEGCVPNQAVCRTISMTDSRITWFPESPYEPLPDLPSGYHAHPFTVVNGGIIDSIISIWGLGYKVGDIYTDITKFPIFTNWLSFLSNYGNLPRMTITVTGEGQIKLHLLNIVQGGRILLIKDGAFNLIGLGGVELNKDLTSYPNENQTEVIIPVDFDTPGDHILDCVFAPVVDVDFFPVFFGGGIRSIELCGFGGTGMPDDPCCPDTNDKLDLNNQLLTKIVNMMESGMTATINFGNSSGSGLPIDFHEDCTPTNFDGEPDDEVVDALAHRKALCYTIMSYLQVMIYRVATLYNAPQSIFDFILGTYFGQDLVPSMVNLEVQVSDTFTLAKLAAAATPEFIDAIICEMVNNLTGKANTYKEFQVSVNVAHFTPGTDLYEFAKLVDRWNQKFHNYQVFVKTLEKGFKDGILDGFECPCDLTGVCDPATFDIIPENDCTVERIDDTHWHITQLNHTPYLSDKRQFIIKIRDSAWRCFNVYSQTQGVAGYTIWGCDGAEASGVGGAGGAGTVQFLEIYLEYNTDPVVGVDSIFEIICP